MPTILGHILYQIAGGLGRVAEHDMLLALSGQASVVDIHIQRYHQILTHKGIACGT